MIYLLDTNIWITYLKDKDTKVREAMSRVTPVDIAVCSIVWAELLHGARKYGNADEREQKVRNTLQPFENLAFDLPAAEHYARIRDLLERRGEAIGGNDLMIAAIAQAHGLTVVTHNDNEFARVPGLKVEDWAV